MASAARSLSFSEPAPSSPVRLEALQGFCESLAANLTMEREAHAATRQALAACKADKALLQSKLRQAEAEWRGRKQAWHASHLKHLNLKGKYSRLLNTVRDANGQPLAGNRLSVGTAFRLDGSRSVDIGGQIVKYTWKLLD